MWRNRDELRRKHQRSQCGNKIRFGTKEKAQKKIDDLNDPGMRPYLCPFCFHWHIGHKPSDSKKIDKKAAMYMQENVKKLLEVKKKNYSKCWGCVFLKRQSDGTLTCFSTYPPNIRGRWAIPKRNPNRKNDRCWKSAKSMLKGKW